MATRGRRMLWLGIGSPGTGHEASLGCLAGLPGRTAFVQVARRHAVQVSNGSETSRTIF